MVYVIQMLLEIVMEMIYVLTIQIMMQMMMEYVEILINAKALMIA